MLPARSCANPQDILVSNDGWLERTLRRTAFQRSAYLNSRAIPGTIVFPVSTEEWTVQLHATKSTRVLLRADVRFGLVKVSGMVGNDEAVRQALRRFVRLRAHEVLPRLLELVARDAGLSYEGVRISGARTRWGSCSSTSQIMLSDRLMFLSRPLAIHVCQHELCHTRHMDHGKGFHDLLDSVDSRSREHEAALRVAGSLIPAWMD